MRREFHTQSWLNPVQDRIPAIEDHFLRLKALGRIAGPISELKAFETASDDVFRRAVEARFQVLRNENRRNYLENDETDNSFLQEVKSDIHVDKRLNDQILREQAVLRSDTFRLFAESILKNQKVKK